MRLLERKVPPPLLAVAIALLMWATAGYSPALTVEPLLRKIAVAALTLSGAAIDLLAMVAFLKQRTAITPFQPAKASTLVTSGVYRFTRNPMYVGLLLLLSAWALWLSAWGPLAGPVFFFLYVNRFQIEPEEKILAEVFGAAYFQYLRDVRRWL
jgi:protein-S-isoprenylcysteine O-methyltransferase Ste14